MSGEENVVRDLVVEHQGRSHRATYFVEHGQIYIKTGAKLFRLPVTKTPPAEAVRAMLIGLAADAAREAGQSARWAEILGGGSAAAK